jgi:ketosteroid isomerase-like protein
MSETEKRNLEVVERWAQTYNSDIERMVTECYAENCKVSSMLSGAVIEGQPRFLKLELRVAKVSPRRHLRIDHTHVAGDVVVVEATLFDPDQGADWKSPFCAVLTLKDGKIIEDRTYMDDSKWPGFQRPS